MRLVLVFIGLMFLTPRVGPAALPQSSPLNISESGNSFMQMCKHIDDYANGGYTDDNLICVSWTTGFVDGVWVSEAFRKTPATEQMFCLDEKITTLQMVHVIKKYVADNPAKEHMPTRYLASDAFIMAFPCKR
jgi:hypothetical protein